MPCYLQGMATAEKSPPLPVQALPPCLIQPSLSGSTSLTHVLFYSVPPSPKWLSSTVWTHTLTHTFFTNSSLPILSICPDTSEVTYFSHLNGRPLTFIPPLGLAIHDMLSPSAFFTPLLTVLSFNRHSQDPTPFPSCTVLSLISPSRLLYYHMMDPR